MATMLGGCMWRQAFAHRPFGEGKAVHLVCLGLLEVEHTRAMDVANASRSKTKLCMCFGVYRFIGSLRHGGALKY
jgi:hypothetical protein